MPRCPTHRSPTRPRRSATGGFHELAVIGEGGFGRVYRCMLGPLPVAVKVMDAGGLQVRQCTVGGGFAIWQRAALFLLLARVAFVGGGCAIWQKTCLGCQPRGQQ